MSGRGRTGFTAARDSTPFDECHCRVVRGSAGREHGCTRRSRGTQREAAAFTLIELLVVLGIILLVIGTAAPSVVNLFGAGADSQAYNILAAQLTGARAVAIRRATYAAVHCQLADLGGMEDRCYVAILWDDPGTAAHEFSLAPDHMPRELPGGMAFGQITDSFVAPDGSYPYDEFDAPDESELRDFTRFTIVFSPTGSVVKRVAGGPVAFSDGPGDIFFPGAATSAGLWRTPNQLQDQSGVTAVALFNYAEARSALPNAAGYLNRQAPPPQWILINMCTGQLFARQ